jgi:FKBP-type peptidyl-prolyl cis-trans isomerase FkpA
MAGGPRRIVEAKVARPGFVLAALLVLPGCIDSGGTGTTVPDPLPIEQVEFASELGVNLSVMEERQSGLWLLEEEEGEGAEATVDTQLTLDYEGWIPNGTLFDSSLERGEPLQLALSVQSVIPGFAEGILGMQAGGQRLLLIPPHLGYGPQQVNTPSATIPPNSWLVFRVYMRSVDTP